MWYGVGPKISTRNMGVRIEAPPMSGELRGEIPCDGTSVTRAAVDVEKTGHVVRSLYGILRQISTMPQAAYRKVPHKAITDRTWYLLYRKT
jgi:hypothetical protein